MIVSTTWMFHQNVYPLNVQFKRVSIDKTTNRVGYLLLDLCKAVQMRILNGRLYDDAEKGAFTCICM